MIWGKNNIKIFIPFVLIISSNDTIRKISIKLPVEKKTIFTRNRETVTEMTWWKRTEQ